MRVGDVKIFNIERTTLQGEGVARPEGKVLFIPGCLSGEQVRARITQQKKNFSRGELLEVLQPSTARVAAPCPVFGKCGGCQLQMMDYSNQLDVKREAVRDALSRLGRLPNVRVEPILASPRQWHYRNRVQMHVRWFPGQPLQLGYYRLSSREMIEYDGCPLMPESFPPILASLRHWLPEIDVKQELPVKHLVLKTARSRAGHDHNGMNEIMMILVVTRWSTKHSQLVERLANKLMTEHSKLVSVFVNVNEKDEGEVLGGEYPFLAGKERLVDNMSTDLKLNLGPASFLQVNPDQTEALYRLVAEACRLTGNETVVDAYCGVGSISLYLAPHCERILGIEEVAMAVEDARENAKHNGVDNAEFLAGKVEDVLPEYLKQKGRVDIVILDPPRRGCHERVLEAISEVAPRRIVYVSCDPASLARDAARLVAQGWDLEKVVPVDMFPQTGHVECIILMTNCGQKEK